MAMISLTEYASNLERGASWLRKLAAAGRFETAQKIGRDWIIDSDEPFPADNRVKSGKYKDWRKK